ncbi:MAG: FeoA domain-containing protein [Kiritimatiellales bacterium]
MRHRRFRFRFRKCKPKHCEQCGLRPLCSCIAGTAVTVISNKDKKTFEMGICNGAGVRIVENRATDSSMIVDAGEGRYIIDKDIARCIKVR